MNGATDNRAAFDDDAGDVEAQKLLLPAPLTIAAVPAANNLMPVDTATAAGTMARSPSSRFEVQRVLDDTLRPLTAAGGGGGSVSARNTPQLARANHFNAARRASEAASPIHMAKTTTVRIVPDNVAEDDNGIVADHDTFTLDTLEAMPHETNYALTHMLGADGQQKTRPTLEALQGAMLAYEQQQQLLLNGFLDPREQMGAYLHRNRNDDSNSEPSSMTYGCSVSTPPTHISCST